MQNNLTQHFIRFGLIYGLLQVVIYLLIYLLGIDFFASNMFLISGIMLLIAIAFTIYSILRFRKSNGGYMTLKEGFLATFFVLAIAGLITTLSTIVLYNVVDKEYPKQIAEKSIEKSQELLKKFGASEEQMEKAMEQNNDILEKFTIGGQIQGYFMTLIFYLIYAVILGAIFKRNRPPFQETADHLVNP